MRPLDGCGATTRGTPRAPRRRAIRAAAVAAAAAWLGAGAAAAQEPPAATSDEERPPLVLPGPSAGNFRFELMASGGAAGAGAPSVLLGGGVALGTVHGVRVEANALVGFSAASERIPVSPAWNTGFDTYDSASGSARTVLLEVSGSLRTGPVELWAGGGLHVSVLQFDARYTFTGCSDILCTRTYPGSDTDSQVGSAGVGPLLSAGVRLPVTEHLLVGLDLRYLVPATSAVRSFSVSSQVGGIAAAAGLTWRLGEPVPRGG